MLTQIGSSAGVEKRAGVTIHRPGLAPCPGCGPANQKVDLVIDGKTNIDPQTLVALTIDCSQIGGTTGHSPRAKMEIRAESSQGEGSVTAPVKLAVEGKGANIVSGTVFCLVPADEAYATQAGREGDHLRASLTDDRRRG